MITPTDATLAARPLVDRGGTEAVATIEDYLVASDEQDSRIRAAIQDAFALAVPWHPGIPMLTRDALAKTRRIAARAGIVFSEPDWDRVEYGLFLAIRDAPEDE